jgi:hypothetical protein
MISLTLEGNKNGQQKNTKVHMKKLIVSVLSGATLVLAGCGNQGGSSDQYDSSSGAASFTNNQRNTITNDFQADPLGSGRINDSREHSRSSPAVNTNEPGGVNSPRSLENPSPSTEPKGTNNVP